MYKLIFLAFSTLPLLSYAQTFIDNSKPVLVLVESDPWLQTIGSDSPSFAMYDNGVIIYSSDPKNRFEYKSVRIDSLNYNELLTLLLTEEFNELPEKINISYATDQPTNTLYSFLNDEVKTVSVYGNLRSFYDLLSNPEENGLTQEQVELILSRQDIPQPFFDIFIDILSFNHPKSQNWIPNKFEVMISSFDANCSRTWPDNWPDKSDPSTKKRKEDSFSIYIDSSELSTYYDLKKKSKGCAIQINEQKYSIDLRFPFPFENYWMK